MFFNRNLLTLNILTEFERIEQQLPDDQWDEHHWKGVKSGLIRVLELIFCKKLNYNLNSQELRKFVIEQGIN